MVPSWATEAHVKKEVKGIDVSAWQPNITQVDWNQLKAIYGIEFAFIKATEGTGYTSKTFKNDYVEAKAAGVIRGAYHFYSRGVDAHAQADYFCHTVGALEVGDLPLVFDLEHPGGLQPSDLQPTLSILERIEANTGLAPIIYAGPYGLHGLGQGLMGSGLERYPLWLAHYTSGNPWMPKPWTKLSFWQFTDKGASTEGPIDTNWFNGTLEELKAMTFAAGPAPVCKPC